MKCFFRLFLFAVISSQLFAQGAGGVAPSEPRVRAVRSVSGSKGSQQGGRYVVEDPRSTFYVPADKHVIVYFEWDGTIGNHHFEGFWKSPEGKVVVMSEFSYAATTKRFGGYWSLDLNESIASGMWSLDVRVDGEVAGTHPFQIVAAEKPANLVTERPPLSPADIYKKALAASAALDALDAKGERLRAGSAFFVGSGLALTAFQIIDGATSLRLVLPDGRRVETAQVASYNRLQDWAILRVPGDTPAGLGQAKPKSWAVGDRCYSFEVPIAGNRVIVDESITGMHTFAEFGERMNVSSPTWSSAIGSPVLNEYGEVIGVLGGSTHPGTHWEESGLSMISLREGSMVTPIDSAKLPDGDNAGFTLAELERAGAFVPSVRKQSELLWGGLSNHFELKKNEFPTARESKTEFSHRDGRCEILLIWNPRAKLRGLLTFRLYDVANRMLVESPPSKIKGDPGQYLNSKWGFSVTDLKPMEYRVDVFLDSATVWRGFFRLVE